MYYETPNVTRYVDGIVRYRSTVLAVFILLCLSVLLFYRPTVLSSDAMFWLKESEELKKTEGLQSAVYHSSRLTVHVNRFDEQTRRELSGLHDALAASEGVVRVSSLFSNDFCTVNTAASGSELVGIVNAGEIDAYHLKRLVKEEYNAYANVVSSDFRTFRFFIMSQKSVDLSGVDIPGSYRYTTAEGALEWHQYLLYGVLIIFILIITFRLLFKNYVASISAMIVIGSTTLLTFALISLLTGIDTIHMTMPFITVSIAMVDFLYFYYRWHISQYKSAKKHALIRMLSRNTVPALWTSIITAFGLGTLVLVDSDIVRLLSLGVIFASVMGYIINLTFLPAWLSYFKLEHAHVPYTKVCFAFASSELHYNRKFLYVFLGLTFLLITLGGYMIYGKSNTFFKLHVQNEQVELKIPYERIDLELIHALDRFTTDLKAYFGDDLGEVLSLSTIVDSLNDANSQTEVLDDEALLQALFYLDLYGLSDKYYDRNTVTIRIDLYDINKVELIEWLSHYVALELYFVDKETLLSSAKFGKTVLLASSLFSALLIIGLITGWIFRSKAMVFVGFIVNAIPIAWFGLIIQLLDIPLSLEMLIAMTISVGLASDATIHFAFKYFRGRYFGRTQKHALEKMFFYAGIPVIIGSVILMVMFAALNFAQVHSLQLIGTYSALLILISLLTDLFVLPVMLLFIDRFDGHKRMVVETD